MIARILGGLGTLMAAVVLVTLSVANRHEVQLVLDPFNRKAPVVDVVLPFYIYLFAMLVIGALLGSLATWMGQGKWRRMVRARTHESLRWKGEAERLMRERDAGVAERKKQLAIAGR